MKSVIALNALLITASFSLSAFATCTSEEDAAKSAVLSISHWAGRELCRFHYGNFKKEGTKLVGLVTVSCQEGTIHASQGSKIAGPPGKSKKKEFEVEIHVDCSAKAIELETE